MVHFDNSAGRLWRVLTAVRSQVPDIALQTSWTRALDAGDVSEVELQRRILAVVELAEQARADVLAILDEDEENSPLLRWVTPVSTVQSKAFVRGSTAAVKQTLTPDVMLSLEMAARELHRTRPEPALDEGQGKAARDAIAAVVSALRDDEELDQETRELLIRQAAALQHALELAWLTGPDAVNDAFVGLIGSLALATVQAVDKDPKPAVLSKVAGGIEVVANILTIAQGTAVMIGGVASQVAGLLGAG